MIHWSEDYNLWQVKINSPPLVISNLLWKWKHEDKASHSVFHQTILFILNERISSIWRSSFPNGASLKNTCCMQRDNTTWHEQNENLEPHYYRKDTT